MKPFLKTTLFVTAAFSLYLTGVWSQDAQPARPAGRANQPPPAVVWAPKPVKPTGWAAPNKPHWKLAQLLSDHKGQASWRQTLVSDDYLHEHEIVACE